MSKAIFLSVRPEYVLNILNGDKTLELRKRVPKDFKGWVYLYVTKAEPILCKFNNSYYDLLSDKFRIINKVEKLNSKVVARFSFDEYKIIERDSAGNYYNNNDITNIMKLSCLGYDQIHEYANGKKHLYAWHIKKLEIFDEPKALSEFYTWNKQKYLSNPLNIDDGGFKWEVTKAPQSYMYVEVEE